jgi:hypothetical protein
MWGIKIVKRYLLSIAEYCQRQRSANRQVVSKACDFAQPLSPKVSTSGASVAISGLIILVVAMLSGCTTTGKIADCEAFVKTNQQVDTYFVKNSTDGAALGEKKVKGVEEQKKLAKEYLTFFLQSAETSTKAIDAIQNMSLKDNPLQTLKTDYLGIAKKTKKAIDQLAIISAEQSTIAITDAIVKDPKINIKIFAKYKQLDDDFQENAEALKQLGGEEGKIIDKVNAYCGQPSSSGGSTISPTNSPTTSPTK